MALLSSSLPQSVAQFASGAAIHDIVTPALNSVTSQAAGLANLGAIAGMDAAKSMMSDLVSAASAQWKSMLGQLPIALPAMKQVHLQEAKLQMASVGGIAGSDASASFQSYFGAVDNIKGKISDISSTVTSSVSSMASHAATIPGVVGSGLDALNSLAGVIPPPTIPDINGNPIPNPAFASFMQQPAVSNMSSIASSVTSSVSTAKSFVADQFAAADAAYKSGMSNLRAMAFAQFCAQPQPVAVQAVINKTIVPSAIPSQIDIRAAQHASTGWVQGQVTRPQEVKTAVSKNFETMQPPPTVTPAPQPSKLTFEQIKDIRQRMHDAGAIVDQKRDASNAATDAFSALRVSTGFNPLKDNKDRSPEDRAAYEAMRDKLKASPQYAEMNAKYDEWAEEKKKFQDVCRQCLAELEAGQ